MKNVLFICILLSSVVLSGCLYPQEQMSQNPIPTGDQVELIQKAVLQFQKENDGILPIKTKDYNTPEYEKYLIDFQKVVPKYISEIPGNAYESGGIFQYVLINVEKQPTVKLIDLRLSSKVQDLQLRINLYRQQHKYPPFKDTLARGVYSINYKALGLTQEESVTSPFSHYKLPFVLDATGTVYVDYSKDLQQVVKGAKRIKEGVDIRHLLTDNSLFVPAYSLPYTIQQNSPVFFVQ